MVILRNLSGSMPSEKSHRTASGTPSILPKPSCRDILRNLLHSNRRSQDPWLGSGWETANLTNYVYDGNLVLQMRENSTPVETFTRGSDLSGQTGSALNGGLPRESGTSLSGAGGIGGLLARTTGYSSGSWSTHDYYHADGNGNITYLELTNQTVAASYVYDPYGNVLSSSGTVAAANLYRFSSKELHAASGMYYYGYRFYIPEYLRWINRDPVMELGFEVFKTPRAFRKANDGQDFTFVRNNPESNIDPLGLADYFHFGPSCTRSDKHQINNGFAKACDAAPQKGCFNCLDGKGRQAMKQACDGQSSTKVNCEDDCPASLCGITSKDNDMVGICFNTGCQSSPGCIAFHEMTHAVGGVGYDGGTSTPDNRGYSIARCAGCP